MMKRVTMGASNSGGQFPTEIERRQKKYCYWKYPCSRKVIACAMAWPRLALARLGGEQGCPCFGRQAGERGELSRRWGFMIEFVHRDMKELGNPEHFLNTNVLFFIPN